MRYAKVRHPIWAKTSSLCHFQELFSAGLKSPKSKSQPMKTRIASTIICCSLFSFGCQAPPNATTEVQQLETRVASLEKRVEELAGGSAAQPQPLSSPTALNTPSSVASPGLAASPSAQTGAAGDSTGRPLWQTLNFKSLPSPERLERAVSLGFLPELGISTQAAFEGDLTRGQYVAMLVEMNNAISDETGKVRLAREGGAQAFVDVPSSHPYYKYIQGMVDAGYVIGFNETSFQPDKQLTREEMVAIAAKRNHNFADFDAAYYWENYAPFTDKADIAPKYRDALTRDYSESSNSSLKKAFGELKLLHPKQNVKVYEALLSVIGIGGNGEYMYERLSDEAMGKQ